MHRNAVFSTLLKNRKLSDADWRKILSVRQNEIRKAFDAVNLPKLLETPMPQLRYAGRLGIYLEDLEVELPVSMSEYVDGLRGFFRMASLRDKAANDYVLCVIGLGDGGRWCAYEIGIADIHGYTKGIVSEIEVSSPAVLVARYRISYRRLAKFQTELVEKALKDAWDHLNKIDAIFKRVGAEGDLLEHLRLMDEGEVES